MLSKLFSSQLKLYSMQKQSTGKKCIFLNVFPVENRMFGDKNSFTSFGIHFSSFCLQVGFLQEQNKKALEDWFNKLWTE